MNTVERLTAFNPEFSEQTLEIVSEVAERQVLYDNYQQYFEDRHLPDYEVYARRHLADIRREDSDPGKNFVWFLPYNQCLDPNQLFQVMTIADVLPEYRVVAIANPCGPGHSPQALSRAERRQVSNEEDLKPTIEPVVKYLDSREIDTVSYGGASFGADLVVAAPKYDERPIPSLVTINPIRFFRRTRLELGRAFQATDAPQQQYVDNTEIPAYIEAHNDRMNMVTWMLGLAGLTNQAYLTFLCQPGFEQELHEALDTHPETSVSMVWGSKDELARDGYAVRIADRAEHSYGGDRFRRTRIIGGKHAMINDIHLQAALVREGLAVTNQTATGTDAV